MKTALTIYSLLFCFQLLGQEYLPAQHLTAKDGLSFRNVTDIFKDKEGFMWFCTEEGLNRFDGVDWLRYYHLPGDSTTIAYNLTREIREDANGNLLVVAKRQLEYFNRKKEQFQRVKFLDFENSGGLSINNLFDIEGQDIFAIGYVENGKGKRPKNENIGCLNI